MSEINLQRTQDVASSPSVTIDPRHPLISRYHGVVGGEPVIAGTRVTVRAIVEYDRLYNDSERTLRALPHISIEQIQDALGYYHDHPIEIERLIAQNEIAYEVGASRRSSDAFPSV